jgi:hypothetical protein
MTSFLCTKYILSIVVSTEKKVSGLLMGYGHLPTSIAAWKAYEAAPVPSGRSWRARRRAPCVEHSRRISKVTAGDLMQQSRRKVLIKRVEMTRTLEVVSGKTQRIARCAAGVG